MARRVAIWQRCRGCADIRRLLRDARLPIDKTRPCLPVLLGGDGGVRRLGGTGRDAEVQRAG